MLIFWFTSSHDGAAEEGGRAEEEEGGGEEEEEGGGEEEEEGGIHEEDARKSRGRSRSEDRCIHAANARVDEECMSE